MGMEVGEHPTEARLRSDRQKKERTRAALLEAARTLFAQSGWGGTRVEDVARLAGVSPATAFNHFPTKSVLLGHVFAPILQQVLNDERETEESLPVLDALAHHICCLSAAFREESNLALTVAFTGALQEYTARVGGPPDLSDINDPRTLVPIPARLAELIGRAQGCGEAHTFPPARDLATQVTNLLLLRCLTRPGESAEDSAEVVLTMTFGVLRPELLVEAGRDGRPFRREPDAP